MYLVHSDSAGNLTLAKFSANQNIPKYVILSHRWGSEEDEVTFDDLKSGLWASKRNSYKVRFCADQIRKEPDGLCYFWIDTCCINRANQYELTRDINSMFRYYKKSAKCYVYLSDVPGHTQSTPQAQELAFRKSDWFKRGWTLQELLAPKVVEFYAGDRSFLGNKSTLEQQIHEVTEIPVEALRGAPLSRFSVEERKRWAKTRETAESEDRAYCLLGIFNVFLPLIPGEGDNAFRRLDEAIANSEATDPEFDTEDSQLADWQEWLLNEPTLQKWHNGNTSLSLTLELAHSDMMQLQTNISFNIPSSPRLRQRGSQLHQPHALPIPPCLQCGREMKIFPVFTREDSVVCEHCLEEECKRNSLSTSFVSPVRPWLRGFWYDMRQVRKPNSSPSQAPEHQPSSISLDPEGGQFRLALEKVCIGRFNISLEISTSAKSKSTRQPPPPAGVRKRFGAPWPSKLGQIEFMISALALDDNEAYLNGFKFNPPQDWKANSCKHSIGHRNRNCRHQTIKLKLPKVHEVEEGKGVGLYIQCSWKSNCNLANEWSLDKIIFEEYGDPTWEPIWNILPRRPSKGTAHCIRADPV